MKYLRFCALMLLVTFIFSCSQNPLVSKKSPQEKSGKSAQSGSLKQAEVKIQLIRNATLKIDYAGKTILVDPMLSPKGAIESFAGKERNPTVELPISLNEIVSDVDCVLLTHNHPDHWDKVAADLLPKNIAFFTQKVDRETISEAGFINVKTIATQTSWHGIDIFRTGGKHGSAAILKAVPLLGTVSGYILRSEGFPTIYIMGDTILNNEVKKTILKFDADIIVINSGGAKLPVPKLEDELILMDIRQTLEVAKLAPGAKILAVHMAALDHCTVRRDDLRRVAEKKGIHSHRFIIPSDGEVIDF